MAVGLYSSDDWLPDHFEDLDIFTEAEFRLEWSRQLELLTRGESRFEEPTNPEISHIFSLCGWRMGQAIAPSQFPCITYYKTPTPWGIHLNAKTAPQRDSFLQGFQSLGDIRKMRNKGWLEDADAIEAYQYLAGSNPTINNQVSQHDALIFGFPDRGLNLDIRKVMNSTVASSILAGAILFFKHELPDLQYTPPTSSDVHLSVQGHNLSLRTDGEGVFPPSNTGVFIGNNIEIEPRQTFFDVGTGTALHGIVLAKKGGIGKGSDTEEIAVQRASQNAERNGVARQFSAAKGPFFAGAAEGEQFDVIVANLPQTPAPNTGKGKHSTAINAGPDGLRYLSELLDVVEQEKRLRPHGRLNICAASIANAARLRQLIGTRFTGRKVAQQTVPVPRYIDREQLLFLEELVQAGRAGIQPIGDHQQLHTRDILLELQQN